MNYYEDKFRKRYEMVELWCWLVKWFAIAGFFVWLGSKL